MHFHPYVYVTDLKSTNSHKILTGADLSWDESAVMVTCEFVDKHPKASCVLVYREYNKPKLTEIVYDRSTKFPVTVYVDDPYKHTFAVFGKSDLYGIHAEPVNTWKPTKRIRSMTYTYEI